MERRLLAGSYFVLFVFAVMVLKLFNLQIIRGDEYKKISDSNRLKIIKLPAPRGIIYDRNGRAFVRNIPFFDISAIREDLPDDQETLLSLSNLIKLDPEKLKARLKKPYVNTYEPVKLKENLSLNDVAMLEARKIRFPGLQVDVRSGREYLYEGLASHVIGYLGRLTLSQVKDQDYTDVPPEAFAGQYGTEKFYDNSLRGTPGREIIEVDAIGRETRVIRVDQPSKGMDIKLTIDIPLQLEAEKNLKGKTGAIVAIDPYTGEVLALASSPSFDPNIFSGGISHDDWNMLSTNVKNPLINRAIQSNYPPGSTFKVITALAALEEGIITDRTRFDCKGSITFGGREFKCWKKEGHGRIGLHRAIVESCDVFFYEIGKRLDIDILAGYAERFGLGRPSGIDLEGEISGLVPSSDWKKRIKNERWYVGETLNTVIGQGYLTVTPIQMAVVIAALVNGGRLVTPTLMKKDPEFHFSDEESVEIMPGNLNRIKKALVASVNDSNGTGRMARSKITDIGGKTGTAQVVSSDYGSEDLPAKFRDHAWFIAFAPEERPEIAVVVFVEHGGSGSSAAAPIAKNVIEAYFKNRDQ